MEWEVLSDGMGLLAQPMQMYLKHIRDDDRAIGKCTS
jgi:hypothetical protein